MPFVDPPIELTRPTTPLEKRLYVIYRSGISLVVASGIGFILYVGVGSALKVSGFSRSSYPFLSLGGDSVLYGFIGITGLLVCISMGALALLALLSSENDPRTIVIVLICSVAIGLGGAASYYALDALFKLLEI